MIFVLFTSLCPVFDLGPGLGPGSCPGPGPGPKLIPVLGPVSVPSIFLVPALDQVQVNILGPITQCL